MRNAMYQVCTCPILKDTCPIHGEPPKGTLTTSSTTPQGREEEVKEYKFPPDDYPITGFVLAKAGFDYDYHTYSKGLIVLSEKYGGGWFLWKNGMLSEGVAREINNIAELKSLLYEQLIGIEDNRFISREPLQDDSTNKTYVPDGMSDKTANAIMELAEKLVEYKNLCASLRSTITHHEKVIAEREESINLLDKELREQGRKIAEQTWDAAAAYVEYDPEIDKMPRPIDKVAYLKQFEEDK